MIGIYGVPVFGLEVIVEGKAYTTEGVVAPSIPGGVPPNNLKVRPDQGESILDFEGDRTFRREATEVEGESTHEEVGSDERSDE